MGQPRDTYDAALDAAVRHTRTWLDSLEDRPVAPRASIEEVTTALGAELPEGRTSPAQVVDELVRACEPGLTAMPSGRFFGFVIGGTHPAALAADWLVGAWDQNAGMRQVTPAISAVEELTARWMLDLLGLPRDSAVGFATGATTANLSGLAAARSAVLARMGHDVEKDGLTGAPRVRVLVGDEVHMSVLLALRYLGLGTPEVIPADDQGRMQPSALADALASGSGGPTIVVLQAGDIHSGASDPFERAIPVAHEAGAWVHVDGAFGLFAAASPAYRHLVAGIEGADSWATDAHKTLNVPYDCGIAVVRDPVPMRAALGGHAPYLITDSAGDPYEKVPEMSRRARAVPLWALLRSEGREGVATLVERLCTHAQAFADGLARLPGVEVLNDVVFTQVSASFGDDDRTKAVVEGLLEDGTAWISGSTWRGRAVMRISVSNWSTSEQDVEHTLDAVRRVLERLDLPVGSR